MTDQLRAGIDAGLAGSWFGSSLDPEMRSRLASLGRRVRYEAGGVLLREGELADDLGIVISGRIALSVRVPERGNVTILTVEPGDIVGWSAIVPPHRSTSTAIALVASEVLAFDGPDLRVALDADPSLAAAVYPRVLRAMARRLDGTRLQLLDLFTSPGVDPW
jgi:CRP-like cAMP-binding protein